LRAQYQQWQQTGGRQQDFDWQNWSASHAGTGPSSQPDNGARVQYANAEDLEDLFGSASPYSDFFTNIFGQAGRSGKSRGRSAPSSPRRGRDVEYEVDLTLEEAFHGTQRLLEMDGQRITAGIPAGVRTGSRVRLTGKGEPGQNSAPAGDLYLIVQVLPNETFEREGDNLHMDVPVDIFTAIAGGEIRIPSLERPLILTIPPRTNAGQSFRLRGKGMPHLGDPKTRGDLFALVRLVLPDPLTEQEVNSIRTLADARPPTPVSSTPPANPRKPVR
jgi:curved DNA-binding protein